jgi:methyltransferase family protein
MHHIRPWKLFASLDAPMNDRMVTLPIPYRRGLGGISLLESFVLVACARLVDAHRFFEFGTFLGRTTLNLAMNSPEDAEIYSLDLDHSAVRLITQDPADTEVTEIHLQAPKFDFTGMSEEKKIALLTGNSRTFDFAPWTERIDLIFVDGGHDLATLTDDTANSLRLASQTRPSCILWHDYGNKDYEPLKEFLDELSDKIDIFHVEDTMLCAHFANGSAIRDKILAAESPL